MYIIIWICNLKINSEVKKEYCDLLYLPTLLNLDVHCVPENLDLQSD